AAVGFAYNAVTVDGYFGLMASTGQASFDDVKVKTSDRAFAPASGGNMVAAEPIVITDNASTLTQAELDAAAVTAMSQWTQALGAYGGGAPDAQVQWQPSATDGAWSTGYSPFAAEKDARVANFTDYLLKPGVDSAGAQASDYDALGKSVLGKRAAKGDSGTRK